MTKTTKASNKKLAPKRKVGVCRLTGETGPFVDSHIIPRALTVPDRDGDYFIEHGDGTRPKRRWNSWYDNELVIRSGEDKLSLIDDLAIRELRRLRLVWSGWGALKRLPEGFIQTSPAGTEYRIIEGVNDHCLRLFFLSLLWRSAASTKDEFASINVDEKVLDELRQAIYIGDPDLAGRYGIQLFQMSTRGIPHNRTPIPDTKFIPAWNENPERNIPMFRFYFDGLVAQIFDTGSEALMPPEYQLGGDSQLLVVAYPYEQSREHGNVLRAIRETYGLWPDHPVFVLKD